MRTKITVIMKQNTITGERIKIVKKKNSMKYSLNIPKMWKEFKAETKEFFKWLKDLFKN